MANTIDMQLMRYINLFSKISRVSTTKCFFYNNQIVFLVPRSKVSMAIGKNAVNIRKLREILRRQIKVVAIPNPEDSREITRFIEDLVEPIEFNSVELKEGSLTINAGRQSKAALIGRNRVREKEMSEILKNYFRINKFRIA